MHPFRAKWIASRSRLYANKPITAGDGGWVHAREKKHHDRLKSLVNHGFEAGIETKELKSSVRYLYPPTCIYIIYAICIFSKTRCVCVTCMNTPLWPYMLEKPMVIRNEMAVRIPPITSSTSRWRRTPR